MSVEKKERVETADGATPRVAYLMSRFPKITETFVLYEILEIRRQGLDVEIFPLLRHRSRVQHPEVESLSSQVHHLPFVSLAILGTNLRFLVSRPLRYLRALFRALTSTLGSRKLFVGAVGIFLKTVRIAGECERLGVTHVHAHFASHPALAAFLIGRLTRIPYSFTAHGSDIHVDPRGVDLKARESEFAVMVSEYNRRFLIERFGEAIAERMVIVHCGVRLEELRPRSPTRDPGPFRILCVAALREVKGHAYLIEACRLLRERGLEFECELVGEGPLQEEIERLIEAADLKEHIVLRGPLARPDVLSAMRRADALVLASILERHGRREGIPVTLMEAMGVELPVVASRISGIPELVEHEVDGLLTEPRDAADIAGALARLAASPELGRELGRRAREKVASEFDLEANAARLAALFRARGRELSRRT